MLLVVFLSFYNGFGGQELETTVRIKKNHQNFVLRDSLKIVFFLVLISLDFYSGFCVFGGLSWFLVVFDGFFGFLQWF